MTREEAIKEIKMVFEPAFANYIITALTEGATASDKEQETCEDAVSRNAVLDLATTIQTDDFSGNEVLEIVGVEDVKKLPAVQPKQKTGHWVREHIDNPNSMFHGCVKDRHCSECGNRFGYETKFCPNCGAYMREVRE